MISVLIIDTHAHIYAENELQYPPADGPVRPPSATGTLESLKNLAVENHVAAFCAVQPFSFYRWDNRYLRDLSDQHREGLAGVCMLDPEDPDSPLLLESYVKQCHVRGLRSYPIADRSLNRPGMRALWGKAAELGITVSACVSADRIGELAAMVSSFPGLPVVIDHCLITHAMEDLPAILEGFLGLTRFPNVYAKLSFLPLGSSEDYPYRDMHEPCKRIIAAFGPERCVWGNTFPCELWSRKSTYSQNLRLFTTELDLSDAAKAFILGETANRLWFNGSFAAL
jgi:L-fuconolactonase